MSAEPGAHPEQELVDRFFRGESAPGEWARLERHLRECHECSDYYEAARSQGGSPAGPALTAREVELGAGLALQRFEQLSRARLGRVAAFSGGTLALAAAAALAVTTPWKQSPPDDGFQARDDGEATGVEALCFQRDDLAHPEQLTGSGSCRPGSLVKLKARAFERRYQHVAAVVFGPGLTYQSSSTAALAGEQAITLKGFSQLEPGSPLTVVFVFSQQPLQEQALAEAAASARPTADGPRLLLTSEQELVQRAITISPGAAP